MPKVKVEKIIKADREKVYKTITDFENLPTNMPQFFKSIKIVSKENNTIVIEESITMAGRDIKQKTKHILTFPEKHEVFVLEGDAKNSHIIETYEKISEGTRIIVEGDFNLSGKLKLVSFLVKGLIEKNIREVLESITKLVEK
jgi:carbon monoxide dehydrogenase subunit G